MIAGSIALVLGADADPQLLLALGGPGATKFLDGEQRIDTYWLRVWGARALLWAWDSSGLDAVSAALADEAWRVREMALKVVARHRLGGLLPAVARLRDDPVRRVRAAAERAVRELARTGA